MDDASTRKITEAEFADRLRQAGLRVTQPRLIVLKLLHELGGHHSVDDLLDALRDRGTALPRASVYNVMKDLTDSLLVMVADAGPGRTLYELALEWHHHFVCRECSAIFDVPCLIQSKPCIDPNLPGVHIDEAQVIFRGKCPFAHVEGEGVPPLDASNRTRHFVCPSECIRKSTSIKSTSQN
ncbi:MAG: hypothetical protein AMXMBFR84_21380 [Candidatus Hydrogenedentota bacterium]